MLNIYIVFLLLISIKNILQLLRQEHPLQLTWKHKCLIINELSKSFVVYICFSTMTTIT